MSRRRVLEVELTTRYDALIRGPGAHQLIIDVTGRPGVWSHVRRGFCLQERSARDCVAMAERLGYDVVVSGPRSRPGRATEVMVSEPDTMSSSEVPLW